MRWRRRLIAQKWTFAYRRGPSRLGILREIGELIVRIAQEKRSWGYTRIQRALANLNHGVGRGTITDVLKHNRIDPWTERSKCTSWSIVVLSEGALEGAGCQRLPDRRSVDGRGW